MSSPLSSIARPEHTGRNRCWPCTVTNLLLVGTGCLAVATVSVPAAALLGFVGVAAVWLRGYLIPYTPRIVSRLVALLPVDPFHLRGAHIRDPGAAPAEADGVRRDGGRSTDSGAPSDADSTGESGGSTADRGEAAPEPARVPSTLADASATDGEAILRDLVDAGVLAADGEDVTATAEFEERWWTEIRTLRDVSPEELASAALAVAPVPEHAHAVTERDRTYVVLTDEPGASAFEAWLRRPVAVAETAAARALREADDGLDPDRRAIAAHALSVLLETCPVCGEPLAERPAGGCCGPPRTDAEGRSLQALVCESCRTEFAAFS